MNKMNDLLTVKACLESKLDMLETELNYLQDLLVACGFPEGIESLKIAAKEVLTEENK